MKKKKEVFILGSILLLLLLSIVFSTYKSIINRDDIRNNYEITTGRITRCYYVGVEEKENIIYEYEANNKKFQRRVLSPSIFSKTSKNKSDSDFYKYQYWVIYKKDDLSKSLINLYTRIGNENESSFPIDQLNKFR